MFLSLDVYVFSDLAHYYVNRWLIFISALSDKTVAESVLAIKENNDLINAGESPKQGSFQLF